MSDRTAGNAAGRWAIRHVTTYRYSTPVAFATHVLRLTPRPDSVRCVARQLQVTPTPLSVTDYTDVFGNSCTRVSFGQGHFDELRIDSRVEVETYAPPSNPGANLGALPWLPSGDALGAFRTRDGSPKVSALATQLAAEVGHAPLAFRSWATRRLRSSRDARAADDDTRKRRSCGPASFGARPLSVMTRQQKWFHPAFPNRSWQKAPANSC